MKGITVVTEDRKGLIAELSSQLEAGGVNILSINAREEDGTAYVALEVDKYDEALAVLRDGAYHAVPEEVLVIR
ncbi:MAG: hypothetical protein R3217_09980, partial [Gammaproteobacteria bacterium]|nr:hypothetical protein [Gammaproteobacteria bacterium]